MRSQILIALIFSFFVTPTAFASQINWTNWYSATIGNSSIAYGNIGTIQITYEGDISGYQLDQFTGAGLQDNHANNWTEGAPPPYTGNQIVDNAPTANEMIAVSGPRTGLDDNRIRFSQEINNPILAIVGLGSLGQAVTFVFNRPFTVLSEGTGAWGPGLHSRPDEYSITGLEFNGILQFSGPLTEISWDSPDYHYWQGFTVGAVPIPGAFWLIGSGIVGIVSLRRKLRK